MAQGQNADVQFCQLSDITHGASNHNAGPSVRYKVASDEIANNFSSNQAFRTPNKHFALTGHLRKLFDSAVVFITLDCLNWAVKPRFCTIRHQAKWNNL